MKRAPKVSSHTGRVVTPGALLAYRAMLDCEDRCSCPPRAPYPKHTPRCAACEEWWEHHSVLWHELRAKLWEWPCTDEPDVIEALEEALADADA